MAEELALEQVLRKRGAVDGEERPLRATALVVDGAREKFLAGPRFAGDEDRALGGGDLRHEAEDALDARAAADDVGRSRDRGLFGGA